MALSLVYYPWVTLRNIFDKNGNAIKKHVMNISLSCDHRVVDGATGAIFLNTLKEFIENPSLMICY